MKNLLSSVSRKRVALPLVALLCIAGVATTFMVKSQAQNSLRNIVLSEAQGKLLEEIDDAKAKIAKQYEDLELQRQGIVAGIATSSDIKREELAKFKLEKQADKRWHLFEVSAEELKKEEQKRAAAARGQ